MDELKTIEVVGKELKTKDGRTFIAWKAIGKDGKKYDLHFRREVKGIPEEAGVYNATLSKSNISVNNSGKYPTVWFRGSVDFTPYEVDIEKQLEKVDEIF